MQLQSVYTRTRMAPNLPDPDFIGLHIKLCIFKKNKIRALFPEKLVKKVKQILRKIEVKCVP